MRLLLWTMAFPAALMLAASCDDENYLLFDTSYHGLYFQSDTLSYSFGVTPVETLQYVYPIPVMVLGTPRDEDLPIGYEIIADTTTATEGVQFNFGDAYIPADSVNGYINVIILRDGLEGTYDTGYTRYELGIRLVENDWFVPTLSSDDQMIILKFDNSIDIPWYDAYGNKVWLTEYLGEWHPFKLIKMVEYFHALADILPETYADMVELYGENLEDIPYGNPYEYRSIFRKYIYLPMYEYFNDPDNYDYIISLYPDFPFDMPYPFG